VGVRTEVRRKFAGFSESYSDCQPKGATLRGPGASTSTPLESAESDSRRPTRAPLR
jgi:hypothetical protein